MRIVHVEDDGLYVHILEEALTSCFENLPIQSVTSESEFRDRLQDFVASPPDLFVMDVILRWSPPTLRAQVPKPPPEVVRGEGRYRAGLRCAELLRKEPSTKHVPILFYTVLTRKDLEKHLYRLYPSVVHICKSQDLERVIAAIRALLPEQPIDREESVLSKIGSSIEVKPSWGGIGLDLKAAFHALAPRLKKDRSLLRWMKQLGTREKTDE